MLSVVEKADLRRAVEGLRQGDRALLHLRYQEDMTISAIAQFLEIPEGTVKVRLHRTHDKLRRAFENA